MEYADIQKFVDELKDVTYVAGYDWISEENHKVKVEFDEKIEVKVLNEVLHVAKANHFELDSIAVNAGQKKNYLVFTFNQIEQNHQHVWE